MPKLHEELPGGWTVVHEIGLNTRGERVIVDMRVKRTEGDTPSDAGITARMLRTIPMGRVLARTYADDADPPLTYAQQAEQAAQKGATYADQQYALVPPKRGRPQRDQKLLLKTAEIWDRLVHTIEHGDVYDALVDELRRAGYEYRPSGARDLVKRRAGEASSNPRPRAGVAAAA